MTGIKIDKRIQARMLANLEERGIEIRELTLIQGGERLLHRVWEPFREGDLHPVYSVTKSFLSVLIGWLIKEGRLDRKSVV